MTPFPHGLDIAWKSSQASWVVLVSSILDSIVLKGKCPPSKCIFPVAINGISLSPDHLPFFENFQIYFWFPKMENVTNSGTVTNFSKKLGEDRCRMMYRDIPPPSEWIKTQKEKIDIVSFMQNNSKVFAHQAIVDFSDLRDDVFLEISNYNDVSISLSVSCYQTAFFLPIFEPRLKGLSGSE